MAAAADTFKSPSCSLFGIGGGWFRLSKRITRVVLLLSTVEALSQPACGLLSDRSAAFCFARRVFGGKPSSHLVSAVRVTSSSLRGVIHESDINAFELWRDLFVSSRSGAPGPVPAEASVDLRQEESGAGQAGSEDARGGDAAATVPPEDDAAGDQRGGAAGVGKEVQGRAAEGAGNVDPEPSFALPLMVSPAFSFEAAFETLRLEVAGDDAVHEVGGYAEAGGLGWAEGVEPGRRSGSEAAEVFHGKAVGGGGGKVLSPQAESADTPRPGQPGVFERRWRRSQVRRRSDAPNAVFEVKGVHAGVKTVVASDDVGSTKVRLLFWSCVWVCTT